MLDLYLRHWYILCKHFIPSPLSHVCLSVPVFMCMSLLGVSACMCVLLLLLQELRPRASNRSSEYCTLEIHPWAVFRFLRQALTKSLWLAWSALCGSGWPQAHRDLPSASECWSKGHHACLFYFFGIVFWCPVFLLIFALPAVFSVSHLRN